MEDKGKIINSMITLLNYARFHSMFKVSFLIEAKNEDIEDYIKSTVDEVDENGHALIKEVYENKVKAEIDKFHASEYYNMLYKRSKIVITWGITTDMISFDFIGKLVCGLDKSLPKNYTFIGDFKLVGHETIYFPTDVLECECHSNDHSYTIKYDDTFGDRCVYIEPHLTSGNFWHRLKYAVKYLFGWKCRYGCFDEIVISSINYLPLKNAVSFIESFCPPLDLTKIKEALEKRKETLKNKE